MIGKKTVTTFTGDNNAIKQFSAREYYYIFPINPVRPSGRWLTTPKKICSRLSTPEYTVHRLVFAVWRRQQQVSIRSWLTGYRCCSIPLLRIHHLDARSPIVAGLFNDVTDSNLIRSPIEKCTNFLLYIFLQANSTLLLKK
jgi:hypothetical protein